MERMGRRYKGEGFGRTPHLGLQLPPAPARARRPQNEGHGAGAGLAGSPGGGAGRTRRREHRQALRERLRQSRRLHLRRLSVEKAFD